MFENMGNSGITQKLISPNIPNTQQVLYLVENVPHVVISKFNLVISFTGIKN